MKKGIVWLTATAVGALLPIASHAADLPVKAKPIVAAGIDWSGVYVGVHAGYGGGMKDWESSAVNGWDYIARGALVGGQIGINKQLGSFVFGVELDGSWADMSGSKYVPQGGALFGFVTNIRETSKIDGLLTLAGRAGLAADRWFVFAKAGVTWAHENHSYYQDSAFIPAIPLGTSLFTTSGDEVRVGPMLGFGTEYALGGNWSVKGEYDLHYLNAKSTRLTGTAVPLLQNIVIPFNTDVRIDQAIHVAKLGVNYRWGGVAIDPSYAPVRAVPGTNWTGGYVGVQAGYGWGHTERPPGSVFIANVTTAPKYEATGWLAGGTIGANVQSGSFVFGVEGEILGADINGSQTLTIGTQTATLSSKIDWLALATARAGFVVGSNLLLYGKGGVAIANETHRQNALQPAGADSITYTLEAKAVHTGVVAGVGGEYAIAPNWSVKLEYDYIKMLQQKVTETGTQFFNFPGVPFVGPSAIANVYKFNQDLHLFKVGVNYHFNPVQAVVAKY